MPVLMLYADSDTALGTQLVKVSAHQHCHQHYRLCSSRQIDFKLQLLAAACSICLVHI